MMDVSTDNTMTEQTELNIKYNEMTSTSDMFRVCVNYVIDTWIKSSCGLPKRNNVFVTMK